jgi:DNA-binding CsgD family transcriptional regulator
MALHLSSADIAALQHASTVLLAPFAYENNESWRRASSRAVEDCLGGDGSSFALPLVGETMIAASPEVMHALRAPPPDWIVHGLTVRRRTLGLTVTNWDELFDADVVRRTPYYNETIRPEGLLAPLVMLMDTGEGGLPAALSVYFDDERAALRHMPRRKELLRLLFPAFCGGLKTYIGFHQNCAALAAFGEDAAIGVLVYDGRGRVVRENVFFRQMMCCEPERDRVRSEAAHAVRGILGVAPLGSSTLLRRATSDVRTSVGHYRIAATYLEGQWSHDSAKVIALIDKAEGKSVDAGSLAARFSLTRREIEVAQLLRTGLSSREIAADLGISVNTARRHIESILLKLDVHSRTAAAAKLSGSPATARA